MLKAVKAEGYSEPTPIQAQAIPLVLEGRDVLGCAQTGTGKTAAFALPIIQKLSKAQARKGRRPIRALILTPTRELAAQIDDCFAAFGRTAGVYRTAVFGGVSQGRQVDALRRGVDVLVATPGRLLDLVGQGFIDLGSLEIFVLDEADRMLDMGFIHDVRRVAKLLPDRRQTLLFSATMPGDIRNLADNLLDNPASVSVSPPCSTVDLIQQSVYYVEKADKGALLSSLMSKPEFGRALIFTRTKHGADKVAKMLSRGNVKAEAIHGNKTQNARQNALDSFKRGRSQALVATDIASRGIDIDSVTHVINFDLPNEPESYIHRIGRTGRAGASGVAISFCAADERPYLKDIERLIKKSIRREDDNPFASTVAEAPAAVATPSRASYGGGTRGGVRYASASSNRRGRSGVR